jgi:hypothetical protein
VDNKICVRLESKEDMKKRGLDSPDYGDALALTFAQTVAAPRVHEPGPLLRPGSVELANVDSRNTDSSRTFSQLLNSGEHVSD